MSKNIFKISVILSNADWFQLICEVIYNSFIAAIILFIFWKIGAFVASFLFSFDFDWNGEKKSWQSFTFILIGLMIFNVWTIPGIISRLAEEHLIIFDRNSSSSTYTKPDLESLSCNSNSCTIDLTSYSHDEGKISQFRNISREARSEIDGLYEVSQVSFTCNPIVLKVLQSEIHSTSSRKQKQYLQGNSFLLSEYRSREIAQFLCYFVH